MGQNYALVVDDHPLVASGIANFLITHCQFKQACVVTNEDDCYRQIRDHGPPRLLVIDFWLSSGTALKLLKEVKQFYPQVRLLVVSGDDNNDIWRKVNAAGGHGFVLKASHLRCSRGPFSHSVIIRPGFLRETKFPLRQIMRS